MLVLRLGHNHFLDATSCPDEIDPGFRNYVRPLQASENLTPFSHRNSHNVIRTSRGYP